MKKAIVLALAVLALNSTKALAATDLQCTMKLLSGEMDVQGPDQRIPIYGDLQFGVRAFPRWGCESFFAAEASRIARRNFKSGELTPRKLAWAIEQSRTSYCSIEGVKLEIREVMEDIGFTKISDSAPIKSGTPTISMYPPAVFGLNHIFWYGWQIPSPTDPTINMTVPQYAKRVLFKRKEHGDCK
jgi:hypothetical protein